MKKIIPPFFSLMLFVCISNNNIAQQFSTGELSIIKPSQVIIDNYTPINLPKEIIDDVMANRFDVNNPYSYLQIVNDAAGSSYHILFQTNFSGKILYLSYSNNLSALFNKKEKPMFLFTHCIKGMNDHISSVQIMDAAIKCVVERLNYCYDN